MARNIQSAFTLALFFTLTLYTHTIFAQSPQKINYQAVARDAAGKPLASKAITLRYSIHDGSPTGTVVYRETHNTGTNQFGLFTAPIGDGTVVSGSMAAINWASGDKYLQVEIDPNGGTTYIDMGTTQLLSVPFALYSAASGTSADKTILKGTTNRIVKFTDSNQIGNSQITETNNTVAINQPSPDPNAALDVNGQVKLRGGNPGDGYVLQSDANGLASWQDVANPKVGFSVKFNSNYIIFNNRFMSLHFLTEEFDDGNNFDDSTFTCPASGVYHFDIQLNWNTSSTATGMYDVTAAVNGTTFSEALQPISSTTTYTSSRMSFTLKLNKGDVVQFYVFQNSGVNQTLVFTSDNRVSGYRVY